MEFITNLIYHTSYWLQPFPRLQLPDGCDVILCITFRFVYETPSKQKNKDNNDRLKRNLTLDEFITAFGRYKKIMCSAFPNRAEELDAYLAHIVETARVWPQSQKFYEYHKMFSSKCSIMLQEHNIKLDWVSRRSGVAAVGMCRF